ncbi:MAG: HAD family hydrolase [Pseudomonadales bacterium]
MARVRLLTFDLDDTLWEVNPVLIEAERRVRQFLKANCPLVLEKLKAEDFIELRRRLFASEPDLRHQISQLRIRAMQLALQESGYEEQPARQLSLQAFQVFIDARHAVDYFDGVIDSLQELHSSYQLGVLTNGNADINKLDIKPYFKFSIAAEQINASKPAPDHFHKAMQLSSVTAEEMIHIGDHPEHDIYGAQQLGIKTIWVNLNDQQWPDAEPATAEVKRFSELAATVAGIERGEV